LLGCKRSKIIFEDRNWRLTCGNVELRGVEPLTSCMPSPHLVTGMVRDVLVHHDRDPVGPGRCGMVATEASYRP
jgi:hypothetical protein